MSETKPAPTFYDLLNVPISASPQEIRRSYRQLSKLYHPDTTALPPAVATVKFQQLNDAYATLSSPERRFAYDLKIGYSRVSVIQPRADLNQPVSQSRQYRSRTYLDPTDRPLSPGEIFALLMIGAAFIACVALVIILGLTGGATAFQPLKSPHHADVVLYNLRPQPSTAPPTVSAPE
jgi:hypothetical protein